MFALWTPNFLRAGHLCLLTFLTLEKVDNVDLRLRTSTIPPSLVKIMGVYRYYADERQYHFDVLVVQLVDLRNQ
jgi:hypothetical protein